MPAPANERRPIDPNLPPDHPLEPGVARLRHPASPADRIAASEAALGPAKPPVIPDPGGGKSNFIAAARRAVQAAAGEAPARARPAEHRPRPKAGKIASLLRRHARSLIVGLSVMAIVLGTLHMAATWLRSSEEPEMEAPSRPEKSTPPTAAVPSPAPPDEAPAAAAPEKPPSGRQSASDTAPPPAALPAGMLLAIETARQAMNTPALKAANAAPEREQTAPSTQPPVAARHDAAPAPTAPAHTAPRR